MMFAKLLARDIRLGFVRLLPYYIGAVLLGGCPRIWRGRFV